ncbi:MAG: OadG family protein [Desulfobacterales bacterium]
MTGFEAIAQHNGWVMAALGATIVFCGLAVLSFVISLLPKVFALFEKEAKPAAVKIATEEPAPTAQIEVPSSDALCSDPKRLAKLVEPLVAGLTPPFQLADLYSRCREKDLPHPHLTLSCLQRQGYLVFQGGGAFIWKPDQANAQEG